MSREHFPSDDEHNDRRRKVKPHAKVHHSVKNHPKTAGVWADVELRGMLVELWRLASERGAAQTGDRLTVTRSDISSITGRAQHVHATRALRALCVRVQYAMRARGECVEISLRNFARKQGLTPRVPRTNGAESGASPLPSPHSKPIVLEKSAEEIWFETEFLPEYPEHRRVQLPTAKSELKKIRPDQAKRAEILESLKRWKASAEWLKDGGAFVPGVGKFFKDRWFDRRPRFDNGGQPRLAL